MSHPRLFPRSASRAKPCTPQSFLIPTFFAASRSVLYMDSQSSLVRIDQRRAQRVPINHRGVHEGLLALPFPGSQGQLSWKSSFPRRNTALIQQPDRNQSLVVVHLNELPHTYDMVKEPDSLIETMILLPKSVLFHVRCRKSSNSPVSFDIAPRTHPFNVLHHPDSQSRPQRTYETLLQWRGWSQWNMSTHGISSPAGWSVSQV